MRFSTDNIKSTFFSFLFHLVAFLFSLIFLLSPTFAKTQIKKTSPKISHPVVIGIDAGHGGQDPGAIGQLSLQEKKVTLSVARHLAALLNKDRMFKAVLTRNGDYFISVMARSDIARTHKVNVLLSIHADSAPNRRVKGASAWILSHHRAETEMGSWLEQHEKQSELLGGAGHALSNQKSNPYLSTAVLDLQFAHSNRVSYGIALSLLKQLQKIGFVHKSKPETASLGVLRSPDIPSLLVETGFISHLSEEKLLAQPAHQKKIALAIYRGLKHYFLTHPLSIAPNNQSSHGMIHYKVKKGDTLFHIASKYQVSIYAIKKANHIKSNVISVGTTLMVPILLKAP